MIGFQTRSKLEIQFLTSGKNEKYIFLSCPRHKDFRVEVVDIKKKSITL